MNVINLFPTPVGYFQYDKEFTKEQMEFLQNAEQKPNEGNTTSTNRAILEEPLFAEFRQFVQQSLDTYFKHTVRPMNEVGLRITQSWLNYSKKGQWHHKHAHPNSFISGCFYVNADKTKDKIYFYKDEYKQISIPSDDFTEHNSSSWWVPVGTNELIFFPSWLSHSVEPVQTEEPRISISLNTFPVGNVGKDDSLTGLYL